MTAGDNPQTWQSQHYTTNLHVLHRIDGHSGHPDVATNSRIIRVIAAMRRQVKGNAQALLARLDVRPIKLVALFNRAESRVLANCPRPIGVHRRVRTARERILSRKFLGYVLCVLLSEHRLHVYALTAITHHKSHRHQASLQHRT